MASIKSAICRGFPHRAPYTKLVRFCRTFYKIGHSITAFYHSFLENCRGARQFDCPKKRLQKRGLLAICETSPAGVATNIGLVKHLVFGKGFDDVPYGSAFQLEVGNGVGGGEVCREAVVAADAVNPPILLVVFDEGDRVEDFAVVERNVEPGGYQNQGNR